MNVVVVDARAQACRFIVVGVLSNATLYAAYLGLTALGGPPKLVMTGLYALGIAATFRANSAWTFRLDGTRQRARNFGRYVFIYLVGYGLNLLGLVIFVDKFAFPHQAVQAVLILSIAAWLFGAQKFWVFAAPRTIDSSK